MFVNSKHLEHHSWVVTLTRMISAVFRRGGDFGFVADALKQAFGSVAANGATARYVPSLVAAS